MKRPSIVNSRPGSDRKVAISDALVGCAILWQRIAHPARKEDAKTRVGLGRPRKRGCCRRSGLKYRWIGRIVKARRQWFKVRGWATQAVGLAILTVIVFSAGKFVAPGVFVSAGLSVGYGLSTLRWGYLYTEARPGAWLIG